MKLGKVTVENIGGMKLGRRENPKIPTLITTIDSLVTARLEFGIAVGERGVV